MGEREKRNQDVIVEADGGGRGAALLSVVLLLILIVTLFFLFGRQLIGGETGKPDAGIKAGAPSRGG